MTRSAINSPSSARRSTTPPSPSKRTSNSPTVFRKFAEGAGRRGEWWAALFLRLKGYRIVAQRVKTPLGELDLIARRGAVTVFVEVKSRSFSHQEEEAIYAVNRARIVRAAHLWVMLHPEANEGGLRFDVIFLAPFAWPRHIVSAFDATGLS